MAPTERIVHAVLNGIFFCMLSTSTVLLYNVLWEHDHSGYELTTKDWVFMAVYILPAAASCLVFLGALSLHILCEMMELNRYQTHFRSVLAVFIDTLSADESAVHTLCTQISSKSDRAHCDLVNVVMVYLAAAVFSPFVPVLTIFAMHNRGGTRYGLSFQIVTVTMNAVVHSLLMDQYGYYSLSMVLMAMLYLTVGVATLRFIRQSNRSKLTALSFLWFIFEDFLLLMAMFATTFVRGTLFYSASVMILLAAYLLCNFPLQNTSEYRVESDKCTDGTVKGRGRGRTELVIV